MKIKKIEWDYAKNSPEAVYEDDFDTVEGDVTMFSPPRSEISLRDGDGSLVEFRISGLIPP